MKMLTLDEHRARINNLREAESSVKKCFRQFRVRDYLQGHVVYNLGPYPSRFAIEPSEYDFNLLKKYAERGVGLIQLHEEWADSIHMLGADKYTSHDKEGMKHFIDLCHYFNIKIIPYLSSGFIHEGSSDFKQIFCRCNNVCSDMHYKYRFCWAGSPEWREFILPRTINVMDEYGFDGLYNDCGYDGYQFGAKEAANRGEKFDFNKYYDPDFEDLLSMIYSSIKERGKIYKIHYGGNSNVPCRERVYDYLWVGEGVGNLKESIKTKVHNPYVVPCPDYRITPCTDPDQKFALSIPFMQFPLLTHGRPMSDANLDINGVKYYQPDDPNGLIMFYRRLGDYRRLHPNGPYTYSEWSIIPDDPEEPERWARYLALYKPMTEEGSVVRIEVTDSSLLSSRLIDNVIFSLFTNENQYSVISNLSDESYNAVFTDEWKDRVSGVKSNHFTVPAGKIMFFEKECLK